MGTYRTLSQSKFEERLRQHVKRVSKKKRKVPSINVEDENKENAYECLPNNTRTEFYDNEKFCSTSPKKPMPQHPKLRRVSHCPHIDSRQNLDISGFDNFIIESPNKKRRMSLPHDFSINENTNNNENISQNEINYIIQNYKPEMYPEETIESNNTDETEDNMTENNSIWEKYLDSEIEFVTSSGSLDEFNEVKAWSGSGTSSSTTNTVQGKSAHSISHAKTPVLARRKKTLHSRVRNSFKGLQRISSFNKPKHPVVRSQSDPPMGKSSFKSYIFTETLTHSTSTPSFFSSNQRSLASVPSLYRNIRPTLHDIFSNNPDMADNFAIMIPKDPPPEWHKSLKFVIQKAGHKIIGKSSEIHQTTIPEHLKYQLKQIYVY